MVDDMLDSDRAPFLRRGLRACAMLPGITRAQRTGNHPRTPASWHPFCNREDSECSCHRSLSATGPRSTARCGRCWPPPVPLSACCATIRLGRRHGRVAAAASGPAPPSASWPARRAALPAGAAGRCRHRAGARYSLILTTCRTTTERRHRPTVWAIWGKQAINRHGDARRWPA